MAAVGVVDSAACVAGVGEVWIGGVGAVVAFIRATRCC